MKADISVKTGSFTAEGECLEPAQITLVISELQLSEYRAAMAILTKEFKIDYTSSVFRQNRDVIIRGSDSIHDGKCPVEGDKTRL